MGEQDCVVFLVDSYTGIRQVAHRFISYYYNTSWKRMCVKFDILSANKAHIQLREVLSKPLKTQQ